MAQIWTISHENTVEICKFWTRFDRYFRSIIVLTTTEDYYMQEYIELKDDLFEAAEKLVRTRTLQYDYKALGDLAEVDKYLHTDQGCVSEYLLDRKIRCDHPIIEELEILDKRFAKPVTKDVYVPTTAENVMRRRLRLDKRGILVEVLLKHGRIRAAEEVYL